VNIEIILIELFGQGKIKMTENEKALEALWNWLQDPDHMIPRTMNKCFTNAEEELLKNVEAIRTALKQAEKAQKLFWR